MYSKYELNSKISSLQAAIGSVNSKISSLQVPASPDELVVIDNIIVTDTYPTTQYDTTITPQLVRVRDATNLLSTSISNNNIMVQDANFSVNINTAQISLYTTTSFAFSDYQLGFINFNNATGTAASTLGPAQLQFTDNVSTLNTITRNGLTLTNGVTTNTLDVNNWSGNIQTVNTNANLTHYLNFSDSSATGYGRPQKTAGISCNPSTNTITATTFNGTASSSTSAVGVDLTSDDTSGTYSIPFSKTATATGNALFIDNTTTPLTYNPLASTLTASIFNGSANTAAITDTNTNALFYPVFVSAAGTAQTLRCDIATNPFSYNPSTGALVAGSMTSGSLNCNQWRGDTTTAAITSFTAGVLSLNCNDYSALRNFGWVLTGTTNTMSGLTLTSTRVNAVYNVCIINNGSGDLTINTGLSGGTYYLTYTSAVVVPAGTLAVIEITILSVNTITRVVVDAYRVY